MAALVALPPPPSSEQFKPRGSAASASPIDPEHYINPSDFEIRDFISSGGYGTCFRAFQLSKSREVCLKFFDYFPPAPNTSVADINDKEIACYYMAQGLPGIAQILGVFFDTE